MKTALGFCDDENPDGRGSFEWIVQPPATSTTRVWEWDGPVIEWSTSASGGDILSWEDR
jgi:hypothetical protein